MFTVSNSCLLRYIKCGGGAEAPPAPPPARALKRGTVETSPQWPSWGHKKVAVVGRQGCNYDKVLLGK